MFKKAIAFFVIVAFVASFANAGVKEKNYKLPATSEVYSNDIVIPSKSAAPSAPIVANVTTGPAEGIVVGTTDYDYGWNSGWSRQIQTYDNGKEVHMTWHERDLAAGAAPANRRAQVYTYFNSANPSALVKAYPRPKATGATGFGGVDVIPAGAGAGIAVMVYHTPNQFAIDGGPGQGQFTESAIPSAVVPSAVLDPEITASPDGSTLWYYDSKNRTEYQIAKSTDFGATWTYVDSLYKYAPGYVSAANRKYTYGAIDHPVLVAPNGNLVLFTTLTGKGTAVPVGTSARDSADAIGYYKSTNNGANWTWTPIGYDGDSLVVNGETIYFYFQNFGQHTAVIDNNNKIHAVSTGYGVKVINDSTTSNRFCTLYWTEGQGWKIISALSDMSHPDYDSAFYSDVYNGNGFGFPYPTLAVDDAGTVFAAWSQPVFKNQKLDTTGGFIQYELYWTYKNGGWAKPTKLANSTGALFTVAAPNLAKGTGLERTAHILYLADTARGNAVFDGVNVVQVPWIYRTITYTANVVNSVQQSSVVANNFELGQNYPNPFNPTTNIRYSVPVSGLVTMKVYNAIGQEVATVVNEIQEAGSYVANFDASKLASGMYLYKIQAGNFSSTKKMMLVK